MFNSYGASLEEMRGGRYSDSLTPGARAILKDDLALKEKLQAALDTVDSVMAPLNRAQMAAPDAELIKREFTLAAQMLRHGVKRTLLQLPRSALRRADMAAELDAIEAEFRALWLARSRHGGLEESMARLESGSPPVCRGVVCLNRTGRIC